MKLLIRMIGMLALVALSSSGIASHCAIAADYFVCKNINGVGYWEDIGSYVIKGGPF